MEGLGGSSPVSGGFRLWVKLAGDRVPPKDKKQKKNLQLSRKGRREGKALDCSKPKGHRD